MKTMHYVKLPKSGSDIFLIAGISSTLLSLVLLMVTALLKQTSSMAFHPTGMRTLGMSLFVLGMLFLISHSVISIKASAGEKSAARKSVHRSPKAPMQPEHSRPQFIHQQNKLQFANAEANASAPGWNVHDLSKIGGLRFEALCIELFTQVGYDAESRANDEDGMEFSVLLHSRHAEEPSSLMQCKHIIDQPIILKQLIAMHACMDMHDVKRGNYVTTSAFSGDALQFAKDHGINAVNGNKLLSLIAGRTHEQQLVLRGIMLNGKTNKPAASH